MKPQAEPDRVNGRIEKWADATARNLFVVRDRRILAEHRWLAPTSRAERKHVFEAA